MGNNRVVTDDKGNLIQRTHYYPFGAPFNESSGQEVQAYKFGDKEFDTMHGLNQYDFDARQQDPTLAGRFTTVDPMAEKYYSWSPYAYCGNNPIGRTDPTGMYWDDPKEAEELKKRITERQASLNKKITKNQAKLDKAGLNQKQLAKINGKISNLEKRISNLDIAKNDIDQLGADLNNTYVLSPISGGEHKVRLHSNGKVYIETSSIAMSIHEITHVRQSLNAGGLKFSPNNELKNAGTGEPSRAGMEVKAYQMQYSYDESFPGNTGGKGIQGIDIHSVGNIQNGGVNVYPEIKEYSRKVINFQKAHMKIYQNNK